MKSYKDELRHYGIPGQKHGKRRFQNEDGSLTAAGRARYGAGGSTGGGHGILSVRGERDQKAGGGPQIKGKLSGAPVQRTTGNRNPREMGMNAARTTRYANGTTSRRADNGDVIMERKTGNGSSEVIRQAGNTRNSSRTDSRTVVGRNGTNRETYKVVGEDDIVNKRTERGISGEKHEVVKAGPKGVAAQRANAGSVASRVAKRQGEDVVKGTMPGPDFGFARPKIHRDENGVITSVTGRDEKHHDRRIGAHLSYDDKGRMSGARVAITKKGKTKTYYTGPQETQSGINSIRTNRDQKDAARNARADASGRTVTGPNTRVTKEGGSYGITKRDKQGNERTTYTTSAPVQKLRDAMGLSTRVYSQKNKNGKNNVDVRTSNGRIYKYASNTGKSGYQVADMSKTRVSKNFSGNGVGASAARAISNATARVLASGGTAKKKRKG